MIITLKRNDFAPISLTELYHFKNPLTKSYNTRFAKISKPFFKTFKQTAFYSFWEILTTNPDSL